MFDDFTHAQRLTFCRAMANIIASDHKVTPEEQAELDNLVIGTGLSPSDETVQKAISAELANPGSLTEILKGLGGSKELQSALFRMLVEVTCADGDIAPQERTKVREAAKTFGLDPQAANELIDCTLDQIKLEKREAAILARLG